MRGRALGRGKLRLVDGLYVADWRDERNRRHRKALASDKRAAERILAALIRERDLRLAGLGSEDAAPTMTDLVDGYLTDLASRAKPRHVRTVRDCLRRLLGELHAKHVADLRPEDVSKYLRSRVSQGATHATANADAKALKALLHWAVRVGAIHRSPLDGLRLLPAGAAYARRVRRALTEEECAALLQAARRVDADRDEGFVPQAPLWRALLETGARFGELAALRWASVDLAGGAVTLHAGTTKSRRTRTVPIGPRLAGELTTLRGPHMGPGDLVFLAPRGGPLNQSHAHWRLMRLLRAAKIKRLDALGRQVDIHALRHTFSTRLARAGVHLDAMRRLLGHTDPKLTAAIYTHLAESDLRTELERVPSLPS